MIPQSQLVGLGADGYRQVLAEAKLSEDPAGTAMVSRVGERIARSAETFMREHDMVTALRLYDWEFVLIEDDETANAFCMPGGKIAVYTGILPIAEDETGLAVVVGHEVAHALANHGGERMSQLMVAELGGLALSRAIEEKPEETQNLLMLAYGVGAQIGVLLPYSRKHESEADRIGLILMAQAGYDPHAAIPFWQRMNEEGGPRPPEFLSTHPSPDTRTEDLARLLPEAMAYYKP